MRSFICLCLVAVLVLTQAQTAAARSNHILGSSQPRLSRRLLMNSAEHRDSDRRSAEVTVIATGDKGAAVVLKPASPSNPVSSETAVARRLLQATAQGPSVPAWAHPQIDHGKGIDVATSDTLNQLDAVDQINGVENPNQAQAALPDWATSGQVTGHIYDNSQSVAVRSEADTQDGIMAAARGLLQATAQGPSVPAWAHPQIDQGKGIDVATSDTLNQLDAVDQINGVENPNQAQATLPDWATSGQVTGHIYDNSQSVATRSEEATQDGILDAARNPSG